MNIIRLLKNSNLDNYYNNKLANIYIKRYNTINKYELKTLSTNILEKEYYFLRSQPFFFKIDSNITYPISFFIIKEIINIL